MPRPDRVKRQSEKMEYEIHKVKNCRNGRVGQIFKMKESIGGHKKASLEPHAIRDPDTNDLLVSNEDIKKATLKYCADNLKNREPEQEVKNLAQLKKFIIDESYKRNDDEPM